MPSGPQELRDEFEHPADALEILSANFIDDRGVIRPKPNAPSPTEKECRAIDFLCLEWDFGYAP